MASWWSKVKGLFNSGEAPEAATPPGAPPPEPATWLPADDPGNPFGVPILDLMVTQGIVATSRDPAVASKSVSWGPSVGDELDPSEVLARPALACNLAFRAARHLPDGVLYAPPEMDQKWVIAWREGRILVARSWTGHVEAVADAEHSGETLTVTGLRLAESTPLATENPIEVFDWLIRSHALQQKLPFPADEATASLFEAVPLTAFSYFGNLIFCAARGWDPRPCDVPLRSNGRLVQSIRGGDLEGAVAAIEAGEAIDSPSTFQGYSALHLAIVQGNLPAIERLLGLGAEVGLRADRGMFSLGLAIVHDQPIELLDRLADAGADLTAKNEDGFGALHAACEVGRADAIQWLLSRGVDIEAPTDQGYTALHIACALGHLDAAKALVAGGADPAATSAAGKAALDVAREEGQDAVVAWIEGL